MRKDAFAGSVDWLTEWRAMDSTMVNVPQLAGEVAGVKFGDERLKMVCDMKSFLYLCGTELDFTDGLNGKGFNFINPNASRTCGCGESFSI